jgi:hypothetical protein
MLKNGLNGVLDRVIVTVKRESSSRREFFEFS